MQGLFLSSLMTVGTALISSPENFAYGAGAIRKILRINWRYVNAGGACPRFRRDFGKNPECWGLPRAIRKG